MKTFKTLAQMSAIALVGTLAACSSDDDKVQNINPTYDGNSVKTQFAINIPRAAQQTRQTAEITQNNDNFRGMQDVVLYSATADPEAATELNVISLGETTIGNTLEGEHRKVYSDVQVPVGTSHFLFYGQAADGGEDFENGVLTATCPTSTPTPAGISFALNPIYNGTLSDDNLLGYLNGICQVSNWSAQDATSQLGVAYKGFTSLKAGSSASILKAVERLYNSVEPLADGTAGAETQGKIAYDIIEKIKENFATSGDENPYTLAYESYTNSFPGGHNLPEGVACLTFNSGTFSYAGTASIGTTFNNINTQKITYPAALYYYAETDLKANNSDTPSWPADLNAWGQDDFWTGWGDAVTATTRTIALRQPINYGVALLKTNVKTTSSLEDNAKVAGGAANDNNITVGTETFPVTAILIGGQPGQVNWEFNPSGEHNYTIYDNVMNGTIYATTSNDAYNYTMALDNQVTDATQEKVHIAIELQNNSGQDFYGVDGLVPAGSKFYLVASLDPAGKEGPGRVFAKDYVTTANFTIKSLKNAYMTIPDLRSTKLQLGLAVDLSWQNGITFTQDIE